MNNENSASILGTNNSIPQQAMFKSATGTCGLGKKQLGTEYIDFMTSASWLLGYMEARDDAQGQDKCILLINTFKRYNTF